MNRTPSEVISMDFQNFKRDTSTLIYLAIPRGKEITCEGPSEIGFRYDLSYRIHEAASWIISDILTKGVARWHLGVNPDNTSSTPFFFSPEGHQADGVKTVPIVIHSRDIGIPAKSIRSLAKRLRRSEIPLSDLSILKFDADRKRIADRWGHPLSWRLSASSEFTDASILINQCNKIILAIRACKTLEASMNSALAKTKYSDYTITIPTHSAKDLECAKKQYLEGNLKEEVFSRLVFTRI